MPNRPSRTSRQSGNALAGTVPTRTPPGHLLTHTVLNHPSRRFRFVAQFICDRQSTPPAMKSSRTGLLIGLCAVIAVSCMIFMPHEAVIARTMTASPGAVLEAAPGDDKGDVPSAASTALRAKMADAAAVPHTMESVR